MELHGPILYRKAPSERPTIPVVARTLGHEQSPKTSYLPVCYGETTPLSFRRSLQYLVFSGDGTPTIVLPFEEVDEHAHRFFH